MVTRRQFLQQTSGAAMFALVGKVLSAAGAPEPLPKARSLQEPLLKPLQPVDINRLPAGLRRLDLFLLLGQSNMKGRGKIPPHPHTDSRIVMMHLKNDRWYVARDPLHYTGDPATLAGADNAGVGPGMSFAESVLKREPDVRVGLIPCAVGGSPISRWGKGADLYENAVRRARLAQRMAPSGAGRLQAALWLQGEADASDDRFPSYEQSLLEMIRDLRRDLALDALPFIACTIGSFLRERHDAAKSKHAADINRVLLTLPDKCAHTACIDARDLSGHIGDALHYNTASQLEIGRRYAEKYFALASPP